jgi:hypothetical protein
MNRDELWTKHRGLVWSNPHADDSIRLRAALIQPRFETLLDCVEVFGLDRIESEWSILVADDSVEARRAAPTVNRIIQNIRRGLKLSTR